MLFVFFFFFFFSFGLLMAFVIKPFYWSHLSFDMEVLAAKPSCVKSSLPFLLCMSHSLGLELQHRLGHCCFDSKDILDDIAWLNFLTSL